MSFFILLSIGTIVLAVLLILALCILYYIRYKETRLECRNLRSKINKLISNCVYNKSSYVITTVPDPSITRIHVFYDPEKRYEKDPLFDPVANHCVIAKTYWCYTEDGDDYLYKINCAEELCEMLNRNVNIWNL